ncbi:dTDP-4-dehydrorhamnose reductase [Saccharibacter sp. 17.LH.SD]|uniref:dTDP-4-dehydrorhamnose reductase n=1 Tax=Saccharibacter sp. 17.LH.SD TaxID=2689393 RepID=UPI00136DA007|nr:dTDP-4-dehydrorhamnose reductase [Saccharibacter sp. 17.LH.SD]MXV45153.1 dTDP-4-dehydrorhamnose reductase [Saccharibacter sp. 17.LH.SD]
MMSPSLILVIGRQGQLATSLRQLGGTDVATIGRPDYDLERPEQIADILERLNPKFVVNAAAWTAVDLAESEEASAKKANHTGPAFLARECMTRDIPFIHVSTDYVFDGRKGTPYVESDPIAPATAYGRTKAAGEQAILAMNGKNIILRTAWVYSAYGKNFVRTMLNAGAKNPVLRVVGDQRGNPTSADDLARVILGIIAKIRETGWKPAYAGVFHATGGGDSATWYDLASVTLKEAERYGQPLPEIQAIKTEDWPTPAPRPADSRLSNEKLERIFGLRLPDWKQSVAATVQRLMKGL